MKIFDWQMINDKIYEKLQIFFSNPFSFFYISWIWFRF